MSDRICNGCNRPIAPGALCVGDDTENLWWHDECLDDPKARECWDRCVAAALSDKARASVRSSYLEQ